MNKQLGFGSTFACTLVLISAFACQAMAGAMGRCKISVSLSPAGSFVAQSSQVVIRGTAIRSGDKVSASNIALKIDTLKTGISLRDEHMNHKYFESGLQFPRGRADQGLGPG